MEADSVVVVLSDGKPGHVNQSMGLAQALVAQGSAADIDIRPVASLKTNTHRPARPSVLIGTGRRCLAPLLWLKRRWQVPAVALMRAGWRTPFFDAVIVPHHDRLLLPWPNVWRSEGALNACRPRAQRGDQVAVLLGGPSRHVRWSDALIWQQLEPLLTRYPGLWVITSRRTPASLLDVLRVRLPEGQLLTPEDCAPDWLRHALADFARVWVSRDSVSMIYEALTAGVPVSLLELPWASSSGKMQRSIQRLKKQGFIDRDPVPPLQEAARCAQKLRATLSL